MNLLLVSLEGLCGDLAWHLTKEGHSTKVYIKHKTDANDGFFSKVSRWQGHTGWADLIVFDDVGFGLTAEYLRRKGKPVVGGSRYADRLEEDRAFAQREMERFGIRTLPHWDFRKFSDALAFLHAHPGRYVFKPCGNIPSHMKDYVVVGDDEKGRDLEAFLRKNKRLLSRRIKRFQLQRFVDGVEVAVGAFFNGDDFVLPVNMNFEYKRLFPGNLGPLTGDMGTLMWWSRSSVIFDQTLASMKMAFKESGYVGYIDLNCIANADGIFPLEFTCRFGYPTISIQMEGLECDFGDFLFSLAKGETNKLAVKEGYHVGVVIAVPPFPFEDRTRSAMYRNLPILFRTSDRQGIHLGDTKLTEGRWTTDGQSGYVLVVAGSGSTVAQALKRANSRIENICLPNKYYRNDIGQRWQVDSSRLKSWGYL